MKREKKKTAPKKDTGILTSKQLEDLTPEQVADYYSQWSYHPNTTVEIPSELFLETSQVIGEIVKLGSFAMQVLGYLEHVHKVNVNKGIASPIAEVQSAYQKLDDLRAAMDAEQQKQGKAAETNLAPAINVAPDTDEGLDTIAAEDAVLSEPITKEEIADMAEVAGIPESKSKPRPTRTKK